MVFRAHNADEAATATSRKARGLLHVNLEAEEFTLAFATVQENDKQIAMLARSMLEILIEASAGVEIPASDVDEGRVTTMEMPGGASELGSRFKVRVHSSDSRPDAGEAFTTVRYRNHWFWVDDRDVPSKRSLGFLMVLFTLLQSGTPPPPPGRTISKP